MKKKNKTKYCYCAGCGTRIEEEKSFDIKSAQSTQEDAVEAQNATPEPIQEEPIADNPGINNDIGLAVGAALLFGYGIHRRVLQHRRHIRRRMMRHNRTIQHNRTMRRGS